MKKLILIVLYVLFSLCACTSSVPFQYDALEDEVKAAETAVPADPKRIEKANKRLEHFEDVAMKAAAHYENRSACMQSGEHVWACNERERYNPDKPPKDTDELVRTYRRDDCGCMSRENFERMLRQMSY